MLSRTAKESIKTALGVTVAYAIALSMDWDRPYWAAMAVAMCSLATLGDSLTKAAHRMLGTALAIGMTLLILSLTIQERWWFMVALSAWLAFCAYRAPGSRTPYVWQTGGFISAIIAIDASGIPVLAVAQARAATQRELFQACRRLLGTGEGGDDVKQLRAQLLQQQNQFDQLLESARADTAEVAETIGQWRRYQHQAAALTEELVRWQQGFVELRALDLAELVPGMEAFDDEIERRLGEIERMLGGQAPEHAPETVTLSLAPGAQAGLQHFDAAALTVAASRLERIESSTRSLFDLVADIEGFDRPEAGVAPQAPGTPQPQMPPVPWFLLDPDQLSGAVRVLAAVWLAYLVYLYVPDIPGGTLIVVLTAALSVLTAPMPQVPMTMLISPLLSAVLFASVFHVLVMWRFESFLGLGPLIFMVVFGYCYLFPDLRHMLNRMIGLAFFFIIASITNEQSYSFLRVAGASLGMSLAVVVLIVTAYVPHLPLAEQAFMRLSRRFFRSCAWLVSDLSSEAAHGETRPMRWRRAYHLREVTTLPRKLAVWGMFINPKALPGTTPAQVTAVVSTVQGLMGRLQELREARGRTDALAPGCHRCGHAPRIPGRLPRTARDADQGSRRPPRHG